MKLLKELVVMTTTIICGLIMVSSCSSDSFESQKPAMLTIEATNLKLVVGETEARVATTNSDGAVTYISSDVAVATVDKEGKVTAVSAGEATITVLVAKTARFTFAQTSYKVIVGFARVVDLGLSVKWADRNVGASNPEDYGDYFSWGETTATGNYDWSTYTLCEGTVTSMTKYCNDSYYGTVDDKTTLEFTDDAARANWGGTWRMPTIEEINELKTRCTWTKQAEKNGYEVTGPNGNSIFLPSAGYRYEGNLFNPGAFGYYWSSSLFTSHADYARLIFFYGNFRYLGSSNRCYGQSIRPVTDNVAMQSE